MIIVSVILISANTGKATEIGRMAICNEGGTEAVGDYSCETYRGRSSEELGQRRITRSGNVTGHRRKSLHVWHLVAKALGAMGYGER